MSSARFYRECSGWHAGNSARDELIAFPAAEDRAETGPGVGRETRARHRISQRKGSQSRPDGPAVIRPLPEEKRNSRIFKDLETAFVRVQDKTFDSNAEIAMEEVFDV